MAYLVVIGSILALAAGGAVILEKLNLMDGQMELPVPGLLAALAAVLYPSSWALSVRWYEKREF